MLEDVKEEDEAAEDAVAAELGKEEEVMEKREDEVEDNQIEAVNAFRLKAGKDARIKGEKDSSQDNDDYLEDEEHPGQLWQVAQKLL